jgi:acid stress-induced BolA-like protein IbaG/YrbA
MAKATRTRNGSSGAASREDIKRVLTSALRAQFPAEGNYVDVSDGYDDLIHVLVVSRIFDGMTEQARQDLVWDALERAPLTRNQKRLVSLVVPLTPDQVKRRAI